MTSNPRYSEAPINDTAFMAEVVLLNLVKSSGSSDGLEQVL